MNKNNSMMNPPMNEPNRVCGNRDTLRYVGYSTSVNPHPAFESLFCDKSIKSISREITKHLGTELMNGRPIVVPDERIRSVMSELNNAYREETGDIYGRYNVPNNNLKICDKLRYETITAIVDNVRNTLEMENINGKLSIWDTVLGDFNEKGLRSHAPITAEINNTRRLFQINMNY